MSNEMVGEADDKVLKEFKRLNELVEQFPQESNDELDALQNEIKQLTQEIHSYSQQLQVCKKTLNVGQQIIDVWDYCDKANSELDEITLQANEMYSHDLGNKNQ